MRADIQIQENIASFYLDKVNQCAWLDERQISLSPKAFSVLLYLADRQGRLVTKQELLDNLWPDVFVTEGVLKRAVVEVRKALFDSAEEPRFIQTCHRRGYRFLAQNATPRKPAVQKQRCRLRALLRVCTSHISYRRRVENSRSYRRGTSLLRMGEVQ